MNTGKNLLENVDLTVKTRREQKRLKGNQTCLTRYVIYKMTCQICKKFYIGQTNRPFYYRYREHEYSLHSKTDASALSEHALSEHQDVDMSVTDFKFEFIGVCKNPVQCKIREAKLIESTTPGLNRNHELRHW